MTPSDSTPSAPTQHRGSGGEVLVTEDGALVVWPEFMDAAEARALFDDLHASLDWKEHWRWSYGRFRPAPRLTAWYGPVDYAYSGIVHEAADWPEILVALRIRIEALVGATFNSVLCNLYRDGGDSVGWHADDEAPLGPTPTLASFSLGAPRRFALRKSADHPRRKTVTLTPGSLLVMAGALQQHWEHQVPKTTRPVGPRINLTFRTMRDA